MKRKLIITINREYGSGGKIIGQKLSQKLGIPYYDDDIIKLASENSAVGEEFFRMNDEKPGNNILYKIIGGLKTALNKPTIKDDITNPDNLFRFESEVIRELANEESCILIGRCADFVLESSGFEDFVNLYVYSDLPTKLRRVMEVDGVDTKEALLRVQKINKSRSEYYRYYTGESWDDMNRYDLTINTTKLELDAASELVIKYLSLLGYDV
jgi:putative cytidylate kinase